MNKKLFLLPIMAIVLILGGCSNSNRIDTSSLVQTITAENKSGKAVYNFYPVSYTHLTLPTILLV